MVPTALPDRPMDVCTLHRYRTRLGLSKRACRWIAYAFGQLYPRYLSSSIRRKHPIRGFIMAKEEAQMLRSRAIDRTRPVFPSRVVPLPPNWKETNSFVTVVVDDVSDSATFLNFLSSTSTSTQLSNNNGLVVYACDKFSFRQILFYIFDLFSHAREPVVDYLLLFDPSETVQRLATVRKSVS